MGVRLKDSKTSNSLVPLAGFLHLLERSEDVVRCSSYSEPFPALWFWHDSRTPSHALSRTEFM